MRRTKSVPCACTHEPRVAGWSTTARRVFERHATANIVALIVCGIPALYLVTHDHAVLGAALCAGPAAALAYVHWSAPPRQLRRLVARTRGHLPSTDGRVALRGRVAAIGAPLAVPATAAVGAAYWWRTIDTSEGSPVTSDEGVDATDFVLRCGDQLVAVEGLRARVLFDPRDADVTDRDASGWREVQLARVGDEVVVEGWLRLGPSTDPHRAAATLSGSDAQPTIGLIAGGRGR